MGLGEGHLFPSYPARTRSPHCRVTSKKQWTIAKHRIGSSGFSLKELAYGGGASFGLGGSGTLIAILCSGLTAEIQGSTSRPNLLRHARQALPRIATDERRVADPVQLGIPKQMQRRRWWWWW